MKKFLLTSILALGLLASCGGEPAASAGSSSAKPTASTSKSTHTHTFDETKWEADESQHWHPATCEHSSQKGSAAAHTLVEDATKSKAATCEEDGVKVSVCSVCGREVTETIKATGHVWTAQEATGLVNPETCQNNHHAYRFDVSAATGWNDPATKMNGKPNAGVPTNKSESSWTFEAGQLPAGSYDVYIIGRMTYSTHGNRTWANQSANDPATENPDTADQSPFRYWIEIGETVYNPNVTETWSEIGYDAENDKAGLNAKGITVSEGATVLKLEHGNIGYSMIISAVRLVKK